MTTTRSLARRLVLTLSALAVGVGLIVTVTVPGSLGAFTAKITNPGNAVTTAPYLTCTSASTGLGAALAWPLDDAYITTGTVGARDVSGNNRTGLYSLTGVAYRQGTDLCPRDRTTSTDNFGTILDGRTGYVYYPTAFPLTNTFTESLWFSTTTTQGGRLIGFGNATVGASSQYDRHVWMNNNGQLYFGVYPNAVRTVNSSASYNDGKRHHVVATLGTNGMSLYVDGALVAQDTTTTTAQTYNSNAMYLRVGYDNIDNWGANAASYYFQGYVRFADYFTATLSAAQVKNLYLSGTGS